MEPRYDKFALRGVNLDSLSGSVNLKPRPMFYFTQNWRLWIRPAVTALYIVTLVILIPFLIVNGYRKGFSKSNQAELIGGIFVMLTLPVSLWEIVQHIVHYNKPYLQKHIIRVLWMVPIYSLNAWLGLVFPSQSIYMDSLRECYEAYVIYNFMIYLLNYLNSRTNLEAALELRPQVHHFFPLCCLPDWEMGREFVHMCKHGILQYTVIRPFMTAVSFLCELNGVYGEGEFRGDVAFPYMILINNLSQFVAMYCLVLFYKANKDDLQPMKPVGKFLCIKAVVFFSFFQGVIISILVYTGVISSVFDTNNTDKIKMVSSKLQDFLICIEMFLAAIAHRYSFSYKPFVPRKSNSSEDTLGCWDAFAAMWDVSDVHKDLREHIGVVGSSLSRTIRGQHGYKSLATESSSLLLPTNEADDTPNKSYSSLSGSGNVWDGVNNDGRNFRGLYHAAFPIDPDAEIDNSAKEAEKCVIEDSGRGPNPSGGIPVESSEMASVDFAPEFNFNPISKQNNEKT